MTRDVERVAEALRTAGLDRLLGRIAPHVRPSVRLRSRPAAGTPAVGTSRFGGLPDLPAGAEWPTRAGRPLSFIGQIALVEVAPHDGAGLLPTTGLLSFFYDAAEQPWGFDPKGRDGWQVPFFETPTGLAPRLPPRGLGPDGVFTPRPVEPAAELTIPDLEAPELEGLDVADTDAYCEAQLALAGAPGGAGPRHRMLGWADQVQGDVRQSVALPAAGIYAGDASAYRDPRAGAVLARRAEWQLLLQVDSDEDSGMMWGDLGRLYFMIREEDLRARRFGRVWLELQCS